MENKIYAPITITTLNRVDHLKRCLESLQRNTDAEKTEIFIAVDYPPSEKYVEGYNKVREFLSEPLKGFKEVHIIYRTENYGALDNSMCLKNEIFSKYDRVISLEDDNELAPDFLDFCNQGLELYKDDNSIIALNASNYVWCGAGMKQKNPQHQGIKKRQLIFHAYATWKNKWNEVNDWCVSRKILLDATDPRKVIKLRLASRCFFYTFVDNVLFSRKSLPWHENKLYSIDQVWDYYMMMYDKYVICPEISLTRDWGCDGSGVHYKEKFDNMQDVITVQLDQSSRFIGFENKSPKVDKYEVFLHGIHIYRNPINIAKEWAKCFICFGSKKFLSE